MACRTLPKWIQSLTVDITLIVLDGAPVTIDSTVTFSAPCLLTRSHASRITFWISAGSAPGSGWPTVIETMVISVPFIWFGGLGRVPIHPDVSMNSRVRAGIERFGLVGRSRKSQEGPVTG